MGIGKKKNKKGPEKEKICTEDLIGDLRLLRRGTPEGHTELESYPLNPPFAYACILQNDETQEYLYMVDELTLSKEEREAYKRLKNILGYELKAPEPEETLVESFNKQVPEVLQKNQKLLGTITDIGYRKIRYYLERDMVGYGKIDPFMYDLYVEDISCTGVNKPVYLWHRRFENIKTNVIYPEEEELDDFVMKVVHRAGKHVSIAYPIVDLTLPKKHRLAVTFGKETTPAGTSFTIRKFREDPLTIIDLIENETIDETIAAYLWLLMDNKMSVMIAGATGAGKTTALNAIGCLTNPEYKMISIEEVAEINLTHENWTSTIARPGFGAEKQGEITLYDLIKSAVRHRPDMILVGEIRGEEAYVLFQALATGHGGLCTTHADDIETTLKRLTQPPMNIPPSILPLMNCMIIAKRVKAPTFIDDKRRRFATRKFARIAEIKDADTVHDAFRWNPSMDTFQNQLEDSYLLSRISKDLDVPLEVLYEELERRKQILMAMAERGIRDFRSVSVVLSRYHKSPHLVEQEFIEKDAGWIT
ncbi:MAG: type II/IV secretion system ATPase subunit [Candidatus Bathyarchaeota archaeon]|nr:type II/IV secretion system ATPase subunit [Candidatus Bathyarchaeota archaeon]